MGFRFSKRITLAPGLRMNLSPSGVSWSVGPRGASISLGKRGTYANVGLPGTGLSYRTRLDRPEGRPRTGNAGGASASQIRAEQLAQREAELAGQVIEAQIRITDGGDVDVLDPRGQPLAGPTKSLFWQQRGEEVRRSIDAYIAELALEYKELTDIHLETPAPVFSAHYEPNPFAAPSPQRPEPPAALPEPTYQAPEELSLVQRMSSQARAEHTVVIEQARRAHQQAMDRWRAQGEAARRDYEQAVARWQQQRDEWVKKKDAHDREQDHIRRNFRQLVSSHTGFMADALDEVLSGVAWPRETLVSYQIEAFGHALSIDIDLPEIDDIPSTSASVSANGRKILFKRRPKADVEDAYARHVHGILLRVVGSAFATLPSLQVVMVSGYTQRTDMRGVTSDVYVLSARISRDQFMSLDFDALERVDPVQCFERFELRRRFRGASMQPIEPFSTSE